MWISVSKSAVKIFAQDLFSSYDIDEITETKKNEIEQNNDRLTVYSGLHLNINYWFDKDHC